MLTIVTGEPGNGKTAYVVSEMVREKWGIDRPLFVWGIPDLKPEHDVCPPVDGWTELKPIPEDPSRFQAHFTFPTGSVVVVDEAQNVYRCRAASSKVPDHVSALETHRHLGIDIVLITQKPNLIDSNVRSLCGRHIHVKSNWAGRKLYEWSEAKNPASRADLSEATTRSYKLPKNIYGLYKSATEHTKVNRRLPKQLYFMMLLIPAFGFGVFYIKNSIASRIQEPDPEPITETVERSSGSGLTDGQRPAARSRKEAKTVLSAQGHIRLISATYLSIGPKIMHRHFQAEDSHSGKTFTVKGKYCIGQSTDAVCTIDGQEITF